ncbi:MAG: molybdopterin-dependent oxidoreductase [Nocardioides sp.]|nr:molybdopterin-dependent oxidoreductase [Nocardioides sp.]
MPTDPRPAPAAEASPGVSAAATSVTADRWRRALAGLLAGVAGLAVADLVQAVLGLRAHPVVAVGEAVIEVTPGGVAEFLIDLVGRYDKPLLVGGVAVVVLLLTAAAGVLTRRSSLLSLLLLAGTAALGGLAVVTRPGAGTGDVLPIAVGLLTWVLALRVLVAGLSFPAGTAGTAPRQPEPAEQPTDQAGTDRRTLLVRVGAVTAVAALAGVGGRWVGRARTTVEASRRLLRLPATRGRVPAGADLTALAGLDPEPWRTPRDAFYRIDTALVLPTINPETWRLRVHGLVDRELEITYQDLVTRELTEGWVTLCCVSNPVGGDLIGNAWWSGVRVADLLAEAGVQEGADAVLQTSEDGWNCATPLTTLTDDRNAMLAVAMNGEPLPVEHGFPVRTVVPGLYGYVSATKWVVELEVTRFADVEAYWTQRGWSEQGPVRTMSRIDVPRSGSELPAGPVRVGGVAWAQQTGIERVEVRVDGSDWVEAELGAVPTDASETDTWVQWTAEVDAPAGEHLLSVRATDRSGSTQTSARRNVVPDGATGWHQVDFRTS